MLQSSITFIYFIVMLDIKRRGRCISKSIIAWTLLYFGLPNSINWSCRCTIGNDQLISWMIIAFIKLTLHLWNKLYNWLVIAEFPSIQSIVNWNLFDLSIAQCFAIRIKDIHILKEWIEDYVSNIAKRKYTIKEIQMVCGNMPWRINFINSLGNRTLCMPSNTGPYNRNSKR